MSKGYSTEIAETLKKYFDEDDWRYDWDAEDGFLSSAVRIGEKVDAVDFYIEVKANHVVIYMNCLIRVKEERRRDVAEFVARQLRTSARKFRTQFFGRAGALSPDRFCGRNSRRLQKGAEPFALLPGRDVPALRRRLARRNVRFRDAGRGRLESGGTDSTELTRSVSVRVVAP